MALLLYKSNEMFSSTELIRKSKMIFDKMLDQEIEKAIILRDGKPSFLLMEFEKYENIMAEYEALKKSLKELEGGTVPKKSKKKKVKTKEDYRLKEELVKDSKKIEIPKMDYVEDIEQKSKLETKELIEKNKPIEKEDVIEQESQKEEEELQNSASSLSDEEKEAIRQKILKARQEREALEKEANEPDEEVILEKQIEEEKLKKEQELEEFWD